MLDRAVSTIERAPGRVGSRRRRRRAGLPVESDIYCPVAAVVVAAVLDVAAASSFAARTITVRLEVARLPEGSVARYSMVKLPGVLVSITGVVTSLPSW